MSKQIKIKATPRATGGSGKARRVRRSGQVPAALNRLSKETDTLQLNEHDFTMATRRLSGQQAVLQLELEGEPLTVLMHEVQRDVLTGNPIHVDFVELDMNQPMRVACAITLLGEPDGVRNEGGILTQSLHEVLVECLPANYVESFTIDVSALKVGDFVTVAELKVDKEHTLMTEEDVVIASVIAPRIEVEGADEEEAEGEEAEAEGEEAAQE